MTGVANMRPDVLRAVVAKVPATTLIRRQAGSRELEDKGDLGNPNREADFNAMLAYVPYYNVRAQAYPHMLVTASRSDPRVTFSDPAKLTARLRSVWTGDRMLLLRTDMSGGGHTGPAGREDRLRERAFEYSLPAQGARRPMTFGGRVAAPQVHADPRSPASAFHYNTGVATSESGRRVRRITVRKFASAAEADRHDLEYWHSIPAPERLLQVWRLSVDLWRWRGEFRDEPGLCRSVASVRRP